MYVFFIYNKIIAKIFINLDLILPLDNLLHIVVPYPYKGDIWHIDQKIHRKE